jgi:predicted DNA repair protein MutK
MILPHPKPAQVVDLEESITPEQVLAHEKKKIKSAITTDFILSVEIVIIALGTVVERPLGIQIAVVSLIALIATVGVYGLVALIVRMDEFGYKLIALNPEDNTLSDKIGRFLVSALPVLIRIIGFVGTIALLLVAGGIFSHNIEFFHHLLPTWPGIVKDFLFGLGVGIVCLIPMLIFKKIRSKSNPV